ncbi:unnamed protein product (macronuclear) [Paramecium tetraurelia]|uniref:Transmembrane protein n=1 Tax=Paramecium tetraurelia TaxID=5888 RepID=A0DIJ6_PARTE|nr:uncharacterized protein GSPATT00017220001 [Paramecium tetraurelia]CAK82863.1 unnamed protein product [Paramecium tetraurelia]|eukprot:XP_001450260.1 hypothetical protein (macronuclear) [Paramecium tetraurelia strain d4-2]
MMYTFLILQFTFQKSKYLMLESFSLHQFILVNLIKIHYIKVIKSLYSILLRQKRCWYNQNGLRYHLRIESQERKIMNVQQFGGTHQQHLLNYAMMEISFLEMDAIYAAIVVKVNAQLVQFEFVLYVLLVIKALMEDIKNNTFNHFLLFKKNDINSNARYNHFIKTIRTIIIQTEQIQKWLCKMNG